MTAWTGHWRVPLYVRIWLAVVVTVGLLTVAFGWLWRINAEQQERPARELIIRNEAGEIVGQAVLPSGRRAGRERGQGFEFDIRMKDGTSLSLEVPPRPRAPGERAPVRPWLPRTTSGYIWLLALVGLAVAVGSYPVVRRVTRRVEHLRKGVERWGEGDLSVRVSEDGHDEVAFLASRFNHAAERIETLVKSHKSLLANASHELRSPLARIRMGLELMEPEPSPRARDEITRNIAELDQLIDEILLASRLDAREPDMGTIETVDLTGLAAEESARAGAELDVGTADQTVIVQGVPKLLRRALRNLLENARRYSPGPVEVRIGEEGRDAVVRVCDRGPGVPPAERERIFEPFYRLKGASEREGGVGLGLALVRSIAQRHHGSAHCEDNPGGGACFVLRLPRQQS
jgi:signal transduction histidine kinase